MPARRQPADHAAREQRILDAAARLITHYGYDRTAMQDIATAAGISKGALYLHYAGREQLFDALFLRELYRYSEEWLRRLQTDPQPGAFSRIYRTSLYAMRTSPLLLALFRHDRQLLGDYLRRQQALIAAKTPATTRLLTMMQESGIIRRDVEPAVIAHIMNMFGYALVSMDDVVPAPDSPPFETLVETIGTLLDQALTPPEGIPPEAARRLVQTLIDETRAQLAQLGYRPD